MVKNHLFSLWWCFVRCLGGFVLLPPSCSSWVLQSVALQSECPSPFRRQQKGHTTVFTVFRVLPVWAVPRPCECNKKRNFVLLRVKMWYIFRDYAVCVCVYECLASSLSLSLSGIWRVKFEHVFLRQNRALNARKLCRERNGRPTVTAIEFKRAAMNFCVSRPTTARHWQNIASALTSSIWLSVAKQQMYISFAKAADVDVR